MTGMAFGVSLAYTLLCVFAFILFVSLDIVDDFFERKIKVKHLILCIVFFPTTIITLLFIVLIFLLIKIAENLEENKVVERVYERVSNIMNKEIPLGKKKDSDNDESEDE